MYLAASFPRARAFLALLAFAQASAAHANDDESDEIQQLGAEIRALERKLDVMEQKEAQRDQQATVPPAAPAQPTVAAVPRAAAAQAGKVTVDDTGFSFASSDGQTFINLHGLVRPTATRS